MVEEKKSIFLKEKLLYNLERVMRKFKNVESPIFDGIKDEDEKRQQLLLNDIKNIKNGKALLKKKAFQQKERAFEIKAKEIVKRACLFTPTSSRYH